MRIIYFFAFVFVLSPLLDAKEVLGNQNSTRTVQYIGKWKTEFYMEKGIKHYMENCSIELNLKENLSFSIKQNFIQVENLLEIDTGKESVSLNSIVQKTSGNYTISKGFLTLNFSSESEGYLKRSLEVNFDFNPKEKSGLVKLSLENDRLILTSKKMDRQVYYKKLL
jgi:hypothetical protein